MKLFKLHGMTYLKKLVILFIILIASSACSVNLISPYDKNTDLAVTQLQKDIETFFVTVNDQVGLPECKYKHHSEFYKKSKVSISSIQVRAKSIHKNAKTIEQISLLKDSFLSLEKLHKISCFATEQVENLRDNFNTSITAILKLELAKKRS